MFSRWQVKLACWVLLTAGLIATLVSLVLRWDVKVPMVAAAIYGFDHPIPPNSLAFEDASRLATVLGDYENVDLRLLNGVTGNADQLLSSLTESIRNVQPGGPRKDTIVLYLSTHGVVNGAGEPCFLVDTSQPTDSTTWLPVATLLDAVMAAKPESSRLLMLLDANKISDAWPMGVICNRFADSLQTLLEEKRSSYSRLAVINSCGSAQTGQIAPEASATSFGYFVAAGLRGQAANNDNIVTLGELHEYLQVSVDRFAREHRSTSQLPILLPSEPIEFSIDHPIAHATAGPVPEIRAHELSSRAPVVTELWERLAALPAESSLQWDPVSWSLLQQKLLRLDQLLVAGDAYSDQWEWTTSEVRSMLSQFENYRRGTESEMDSLAWLTRWVGVDSAELAQARQAITEWREKSAAAPPGEPIPPPRFRYPIAATLVWEATAATPPTRTDLLERLTWLPDPAAGYDYAEIQFLRQLVVGLDWERVPAQSIAQSLSAIASGEQAIAPDDSRALYWLGETLERTDDAARAARDDLFVGTAELLASSANRWNTDGNYVTLLDRASLVSGAFSLRDVVWSEAPWLAQWVLSDTVTASDASLRSSLEQLLTQVTQLSQRLDNPPAASGNESDWQELESLVDNLRQTHEALRRQFQQKYRELWEERSNDQLTLRELGLVLRVPLIPGDVRIRNDIWNRYLTHRFNVNDFAASDDPDSSMQSPASDGQPDQLAACHTQFPTHPALAILDRSSLDVGDVIPPVRVFPAQPSTQATPDESRRWQSARLAEIGEEVRERISDLAESSRKLAERTIQQLEETPDTSASQLRSGLSRAERLVRAASGLTSERLWSQPEDDLVRQLRAFDDHHLILQHGWRRVRDFWGADGSDATPYFSQVTSQLLQTARQRYRPGQALRDRLERAREAAEMAAVNWQPITAQNRSFTAEETFVRHTVNWKANEFVPPGTVAVRIEKPGGELAPLMDVDRSKPLFRRPAATSESEELSHVIMIQDGMDQSNAMEVVGFYRGHLLRTSFYLNAGSNAAVARFERPEPIRPRIRVRNDATDKTNVVFVLDCSRSMRYRHNHEGTEQTRLQIATETLTTILQKLDPESYRIGMIIYGSRSAWRRVGNQIVLPAGQVHPAIDVDEVLPLSPILQADLRTGRRIDVRENLIEHLTQLSYRGDTPLYYSIVRGVRMLQSANPDGPQHLVVITDGVDSTYGNRDFPIPDFARTTADNVRQELQATGIKLHLVGFSAPPNHPEDRSEWESKDKQLWEQKRAEISGLATGGFHDVLSPDQLERALMDSLQLKKFFVRAPNAADPDPRTFVDIGRSWQLDASEQLGLYDVVLAETPQVNTRLRIDLGDWFELVYRPTAGRLEHQRFRQELQNESTVDQFFIGTHLPTREGPQELAFRISVQNTNAADFSPRPDAVWVEFEPVTPTAPSSNQTPPRFIAYDLEFEPKNPVPVLRFQIAGWPQLADERAVARIWLAPAGTYRPAASQPIELRQNSTFELAGSRFSVEPRLGRVNEPSRILVDEEYPDATAVGPLHLQISPPPDAAYHVFLPDSRRVQHVFTYERGAPQQPQLQVIPERDLKRTWIDSGPLGVELPNR